MAPSEKGGYYFHDSCFPECVTIPLNDINIRSYFSSVAQLIKCLSLGWEVVGLIPGGVLPKTLKLVLAALSLGFQ